MYEYCVKKSSKMKNTSHNEISYDLEMLIRKVLVSTLFKTLLSLIISTFLFFQYFIFGETLFSK